MAMGFFGHHAGDAAVAWSGGSEPANQVNPAAIQAMRERGIDISAEYPKPWTDEIVRAADVVITMGCGDACPVFPGKRYEEWTLDDPAGLDVAAVRPIRDHIERRVLALLDQLGVPQLARGRGSPHPSKPAAASQGNPIAAGVSRRAAALVGDGAVDIRARFDAVAADVDQAGAQYEGQRGRHLAATRAAIPPG
jgi:protein-tyrosine-phosphatase